MAKEVIANELTIQLIEDLLDYIESQESKTKDTLDNLRNIFGYNPESTPKDACMEIGYLKGKLNACELIEDKLIGMLESNLSK